MKWKSVVLVLTMALITVGTVYITSILIWMSAGLAIVNTLSIQEDHLCSVSLKYSDGRYTVTPSTSMVNGIVSVSGKYVHQYDQVSEPKMYPFDIYGYRYLDSAVIGVGANGYFIFDDKRRVYYLTSKYDHWTSYLRKLNISDRTRLYPGPMGYNHFKRGWLPSTKEVAK